MRRKAIVVVILLALAGAAVAGTFITLSLTGSNEPAALVRKARHLVGALPAPRRIHFKIRVNLPNLTAPALKRLERKGLNEKPPPTHVRSSAELVSSSAFPQTQAGARGMRVRGQTLVDAGHAQFIGEPDLATDGRRVLVTWNDGAGFSSDGGRHFVFVDPAKAFPRANDGFCCDQVALYAPQQDLWIWVLQYWEDDTGANTLRLAVGGAGAFDSHTFQQIDLVPSLFGFPATDHFDYPDAALTNSNFFLSINVYGDEYAGTVVLRVPLTDLAAATPTLANGLYHRTNNDSVALAAGATDTMYFAGHDDTASLHVWTWPDSARAPTPFDGVVVQHSRYPTTFLGLNTYSCPRKGAPPTSDWCAREIDGDSTADDRPTTAWLANGILGVAWNAAQSKSAGFPYPFVMVVRIDTKTMTVVDEPFLWNRKYAYEFLDVAPNSHGKLGGLVMQGGGSTYENCTAVGRAARSGSRRPWDAQIVDRSDHDPSEAEAGDYLGVSPERAGANAWVGSCYTIHRGSGEQNVGIRFVSFARR